MLLLFLTLFCALTFCLFCAALSGDLRAAVLTIYELGTSLLPWVAALALSVRYRRRQGVALMTGTRWLWMALFGLYITLAFQVTGTGTLREALYHGISWSGGEVNLAPFSQGIDPVGYVLNVVLGMPLGFLLPLLWEELDRPQWAFCAGLLFSLLIELSQLCNFRATDVDDLLMNTLGAMLGFLSFRLFARIIRWKREEELRWPIGPWATVGVLFLGRFLFYNGIWLAWTLYGS